MKKKLGYCIKCQQERSYLIKKIEFEGDEILYIGKCPVCFTNLRLVNIVKPKSPFRFEIL